MSTPNFYNKNASFIYAIDIGDDNEIWKEIISDIKNELKKQEFVIYDGKWINNDSQIIGEKQVWDTRGIYSYVLQAIIRFGYYSGANLDWESSFCDLNGYESNELSIEKIKYTYESNEIKMTNRQIKLINKKLENELKNDIDKLEKLYLKFSIPLVKIAQFSNGEAIYQKAKKK